MEVLVTGGTGFLGAHVCRDLVARGHRVRVLGRDFSSVREVLEAGARQVRIDLRDTAAVVAACQGIEAVVHAGALSSPWGKRSDFEAVNVEGTRAVLDGCARHGVKRLVHISSPAVIFDGRDQVMAQDDAPYAAEHLGWYSLTKLRAEELVLRAHRAEQCDAIILRPKAIYGPGDRALLPRLVEAARTRRLHQIGDGENLMAFTFVADAVNAIVRALEARPLGAGVSPVFTVTGGEHVKLWQAIRSMLERLNLPTSLRRIPLQAAQELARALECWGRVSGREPRLTRYTVGLLARTQTYDTSRARDLLGYVPEVSFEQGLEATVLPCPVYFGGSRVRENAPETRMATHQIKADAVVRSLEVPQ